MFSTSIRVLCVPLSSFSSKDLGKNLESGIWARGAFCLSESEQNVRKTKSCAIFTYVRHNVMSWSNQSITILIFTNKSIAL